MKTKQLIVLALILLSSYRIGLAQNYFVNTYGLSANPCFSIVCSDNCFFSVAPYMGNNSLLAFKTDPAGNILWSSQISIPNAPYLLLKHIAQAADGGYLILAYTQISGPIYSYQTVIKLDPAGNFLWTHSYSSISSNVAYSIIKNNDNGFMFVGGGCNGKNYVFKCDQHGAMVWQKQFTSVAGDASAIATHDYNHFVVSGYTGTDLVFFEIDASGNLDWQSVISFPNQGIVTFSIKPTLDNGYVATGQVRLVSGGPNHAFIAKINAAGILSWLKVYSVPGSESVGNDITENSDSSILMVGFASAANVKGLMVKTDKNGNLMFAKGEVYQQSYSEYNSVNSYLPGKILLSGQCQHGFLPTFIAVTDNSFSSFCSTAALPVSDSVPLTSCTFITNNPVNLSFLADSLPVTVTPYSLTKNVLCSTAIVPSAITGSATAITLNSATLNGWIMPEGNTLATFFEFGTTTSYGSTVPALPGTVSGIYPVSISMALTSLSPNTVYHFRCYATDGINSYYGIDVSFVTGCNPVVPTIAGPASACENSTGNVYTTQAGMTGYTWTVCAGGNITAGATTSSITVTWTTAGAKTVTVNYTNVTNCTAATATSYSVTVNPAPVPTIGSNNAPCVGTTGNMYYTEAGMSGYLWAISAGGTIVSGQGTSAIHVSWTGAGAQWVSVNYSNSIGCTATTPSVYNIFVNPMPNAANAITGTNMICAGASGVAYSCAEILNASTYTWTLPAEATIATGTGTRNITVNFGPAAVSGSILVTGTNSCGNGPVSPAFAVTVNPLPAIAGTITGPASVCVYSMGVAYSVPAIPGVTSYSWTIPVGDTITSGASTNHILVSFGPNIGSWYSIHVHGVNGCGEGPSSPVFNFTTNAIPGTPTVVVTGNVLHSMTSAGNQWYYEGTPIPGATDETYTVTHHTGNYWTVVTVNGCSSPISNKVWVVVTGQQELQNINFSVYPVPNNGRFTVSITNPVQETFSIEVFNQVGAKIFELGDVQVNGTFEKQLDFRPLPEGLYSVVFFNSQHKTVKKVLVNK